MPGNAPLLTRRPEWTALAEHYAKIKDVHLRTLFAEDPRRGERLTAEGAGLYLDYSKHRITDDTLRLLLALAEAVDLRGDRKSTRLNSSHVTTSRMPSSA